MNPERMCKHEDQEPELCPNCLARYTKVKNTELDVIGIFSLQHPTVIIGWKCPHCGHEWVTSDLPRQHVGSTLLESNS